MLSNNRLVPTLLSGVGAPVWKILDLSLTPHPSTIDMYKLVHYKAIGKRAVGIATGTLCCLYIVKHGQLGPNLCLDFFLFLFCFKFFFYCFCTVSYSLCWLFWFDVNRIRSRGQNCSRVITMKRRDVTSELMLT